MNRTCLKLTMLVLPLLAMLLPNCIVYGQARAELQPESNRQAAPELNLTDSDGKIVELKEYRGKIVMLDFWATWCHGCKTEIPWFAEFQRKYGANGLNVIGISMDDDGWKVVKPFIKKEGVPYRIVLGSDSIAKQYAIGNMPDTFLIDRMDALRPRMPESLIERTSRETFVRCWPSGRVERGRRWWVKTGSPVRGRIHGRLWL